MNREIYVHVELHGETLPVGQLWSRSRRGRESASFRYDERWLTHSERFALEPALILGPGPHHTPTGRALFGALGDSAPDRWGRSLMARAERRVARAEKRPPTSLTELDYLLRVNDFARQGALRFSAEPDGPFLSETSDDPVPPLIELPRLLAAAGRLDTDDEEALALLLAPGSSLGGARPKASVLDTHGGLAIAKFPKQDDPFDMVRWEALALTLAADTGIEVPKWRLVPQNGSAVLLLNRFDRRGKHRIPFLSAMSMLGADDRETRTYLEIADNIRRHGAHPANDLTALWRRIAFNVLISNTDDHLRNHGFLYAGNEGWVLSPAYDLNPMPADLKPRFLSTAIDLDDTQASIELAVETAPYYDLSTSDARRIAREAAGRIGRWRDVAKRLGLARPAIERMASAFEHADQAIAMTF